MFIIDFKAKRNFNNKTIEGIAKLKKKLIKWKKKHGCQKIFVVVRDLK